jgi:hypothetical protein
MNSAAVQPQPVRPLDIWLGGAGPTSILPN